MLSSFEMSVPADARYRVLGPEVAAKYAALAGCSDAEAKTVLADVERVAGELAAAGQDIALVFTVETAQLLVTLTCGDQSSTVRRSLPAAT
jgi:hypothetical protein